MTVFDANSKPRELHIEKALEVRSSAAAWGARSLPFPCPRRVQQDRFSSHANFFATERWECTEKTEITVDPARFELVAILEGTGSLSWPDSAAAITRRMLAGARVASAHRSFAGNGPRR